MASHILFLISALCIFSVSADVSIDCGSSDIYTDENIIIWTGDNDFMQNGESMVVQSSNSISHVMDTLRVFTTRKKNCYSVPYSGKGERVLVRASFNYGNYDKKSAPPTFDLQLDGNRWVTVETSSTGYVYYEAIYVPKGDDVSACVAQTKPGQFPFMSALEVRSLASDMYGHVDQSYPLFMITRVAYGANETVRFADDRYDRLWTPATGGDGLTALATDAFFIETDGVLDHPPSAVLQNAIAAVTPTGEIHLLTGLPTAQVPVYMNMYFSEVTQLDTTDTRSFQVLVNGAPLFDIPILPPYANCKEMYISNLTASSDTTFALVPTSDSTLPPLINAMEVYSIGDVLTDGTHTKDVEGLASLRDAFAVLQDWTSDPCLPAPYSWDWINCTSDSTPRVTALYLSSFDLSGELPDFSSMDALVTIDFHNNSLDGGIPDFLATFPNLKQFVSGNPDLCASGSSSCTTTTTSSLPGLPSGNNPGDGVGSPAGSRNKKKKSNLPVILGTSIPIPISISTFLLFFIRWYRKRKNAAVATYTAGQHGGNRPQASPIGKMGEAIMNEIKTTVEDQIIGDVEGQVISNVEQADQTNVQPNN
ncbi:senescence-induced receptor-like serine/threonine-protein kinase [Phtheirospermum japonicum]|uniref:Senescence-induced receptor-like serine/threonine-protein kinase n=1 Tax=Phtheirospermum japonicum TaxID=374723 RepID=A0A830D4Y5_9LAMI|nr:senescence-induced receptor-like serine/threonine-protein kinase [Phtheirospermum japonicum]